MRRSDAELWSTLTLAPLTVRCGRCGWSFPGELSPEDAAAVFAEHREMCTAGGQVAPSRPRVRRSSR